MAEHMTAEQLRAELERIADFMDRLVDTDIDSDGPLDPGKTYYVTVADEQMATNARELRALAARLSGMAAVPQGWKLVPIEHSKEMADAFQGQGIHSFALTTFRLGDFHVRYRALLAAAPEPPHV